MIKLEQFVEHLATLCGSLAEVTESELSALMLHRGGKTILVMGGEHKHMSREKLVEKMKLMGKEIAFVAQKVESGEGSDPNTIYHINQDGINKLKPSEDEESSASI